MAKLNKIHLGNGILSLEGHYNDYDKIYVVGDIHGMYDKLISLMNKFSLKDDDLLIFLGDYIDRGPDSALCMEYVKKLDLLPNVVALMGNHESLLREHVRFNGMKGIELSFAKRNPFEPWIHSDGESTIKSLDEYNREGKNKFSLVKWVINLPYIVKLDNLYFSHAGYNATKQFSKCNVDDVIWNRGEFYNNYFGDDKWFVGHTPVQILPFNDDTKVVLPFIYENITFMDTGSYYEDGCISCMEIKSGHIYQSTNVNLK